MARSMARGQPCGRVLYQALSGRPLLQMFGADASQFAPRDLMDKESRVRLEQPGFLSHGDGKNHGPRSSGCLENSLLTGSTPAQRAAQEISHSEDDEHEQKNLSRFRREIFQPADTQEAGDDQRDRE